MILVIFISLHHFVIASVNTHPEWLCQRGTAGHLTH